MNNKPSADAGGQNPATETAADPQVIVTILQNGIVIGDAHHAAGKMMELPKSKADILAAMTPPAVRIDGIA